MNWKYFGFNFPCFFWINPLTRFPSLLSLSVFMGFYFLFFCRVVSASKLAQECICPFSSPFSSLHPMLYFLCPSSPKYWLTVMVALCVSCCCWQVCLLNRRKSKEREGGGRRLESILAGLFVMNCTTIYFPAVCLFSHNVAEFFFFSFFFFRSGSCVSHGLRKEHGFPGWANTFFQTLTTSFSAASTRTHVH